MDQEEKKIINEVVDASGLEVKDGLKIVELPKEEKKVFPGFTRERSKNARKMGGRGERAKPEFDQKILNIRRVARVVSGGRRFSFSVAIITGNRKGSVGVGLGKAGDTALAIDKAVRNAKKNMINVNLTKSMSIPHEVDSKYSSARIIIRPAPKRGIIAGSAARSVIELAGIKDVSAKIMSVSKNSLNIARAAIAALKKVSKPKAQKQSAAGELAKDSKEAGVGKSK
ncbi:MAG: rpsE [Parcubacteria group bacterium]|nr:rpsE [Parcubacteria group bacterium]